MMLLKLGIYGILIRLTLIFTVRNESTKCDIQQATFLAQCAFS